MRFGLIVLVFLWGCSPDGRQGSATFNPHTGVQTARSFEAVFYPGVGQTVTLSAAVLSAGPERRFVVLTRVALRGPNFPKLNGAWSSGRELDYRRIDRRYGSCVDGCRREEVGVIHLSEAEFGAAAQFGLAFQLLGPRGSYDLLLPASAFAEALARASQDG